MIGESFCELVTAFSENATQRAGSGSRFAAVLLNWPRIVHGVAQLV
jgi:hypothetical protein